MSVEFNSNSGEAGGDRLSPTTVDGDLKIRPTYQSGSEMFAQRCKSWTRVAAVCLGLLCLVLLAGIIGLVAHYTNVTGLHDAEMQDIKTKYENMTSQQNQLQSSYDTLTKNRDQLKASYNSLSTERDNLAKERDQLKNNTVVGQDELQKEVNRLKFIITEKPCCPGWKKFKSSCYYISTATKTWQEGRQDCRDRGADLVIINSKDEQTFIAKLQENTWIGLSDSQVEGRWMWVDGTDLVGDGSWLKGEPNNSGGREDCVHMLRSAGEWNDRPCSTQLYWACEI
ncbi:C-type lectin domain family 4 member E-like isoform 2-T2 [Polymixia lowei]